MTMNEQNVRLTAKLYDCRKAARFILGDKFDERIQPWKDRITEHMKAHNRTALQAATYLGHQLPKSDGMSVLLLMAAAVEMTEPASAVDARFTPMDQQQAIGSARKDLR